MGNILGIFKKDFLEVLRERRSLIFMLILPSLVVPLLVITINFLTQESIEKITSAKINIGLIGTANLPDETRSLILAGEKPEYIKNAGDVLELLPLSQGLLRWSKDSAADIRFEGREYQIMESTPQVYEKYSFTDRSNDWDPVIETLGLYSSQFIQEQIDNNDRSVLDEEFFATLAEIRGEIASNDLHAVAVFAPGFSESLETGHDVRVYLFANGQKFRSSSAAGSFIRLLRFALTYNTNYKLVEKSLDINLLNPLTVEQYSVEPKISLYLRLLPYFMVLMCFIGGLYPAIDLVAGEKERNTLETILICPVSRFEILAGKFLVICLCGFTASLLTFASLSVTLIIGLAGDDLLFQKILSPGSVINYLFMLIPLATLFAGLLLTLSTVARNFKQAQSYIMPFNFLILIPAFYALLPGVELDRQLALTPVLNVTLALRDVWSGNIQMDIILIIIASSSIYSLLMLMLCAWLFRKESILFRA
ncbi:MAG: ABC transporter permease subunit [Thiotrichales bacterium]|nr:ABC transporter permease subunit [Thiotrichales bacterium]